MAVAKIVVVEDSEITLFKLKAILIRLGYAVTTHLNPLAALEWIKDPNNSCDLIITDVNMPDMNGFELVHQVRSLPATARTPIIMLTGQTELEDKIAGLQAGADDYLSKSVSPTELDLRVKALLSRSQTGEGAFSQSVAKTISVFSLRGGVGTTSISVNLSIALAQLWGIDVCLWDMSLSGGHCATLLNLKPKNTLAAMHSWQDEPVEDNQLAQFVLKHETGIQLMPAPLTAAEAEFVTPRTIDLIWPFLQGNSSYLVVDAGNHFTDPVLKILENSDVILLVLAPDIASVKSAGDALEIFEQMGFDLRKVLLVVNYIFPAHHLPVKKIIPVLRNRPAVEIPYDSDRFIQSILTGIPFVASSPKSDASLAIISLAYKLSLKQMEEKKKNTSTPMLDTIRKFISGNS